MLDVSSLFGVWEPYQTYIFAKEKKKCPETKGAPNQWHVSPFVGSVHNEYRAKNAFASHCGLTAYQPSHFSFISTPCSLLLKYANYGYRYLSPTQQELHGVWGAGTGKYTLHRDVDHHTDVAYEQGDDGQKCCQVWRNLQGTGEQSPQKRMKDKRQQYKRG